MIAIGLGGNVGDDAAIIDRFRRARAELAAVRVASLYRSAAVGPAQPDYLNTALLVEDSDPEPAALLARLHAIEAELGRDRARESRWSPRTLDLDVLVWQGRTLATTELVVPHPRLVERRFALVPVGELLGEPWRSLADAPGVRAQRVELVAASW